MLRPSHLGLSYSSAFAITEGTTAGIPAGAPEPTPDGRWTVPLGDRTFALLRWVEGEEPMEQAVIGRTLARAHLALGTAEPGWLYLPEEHLGVRPWLRRWRTRSRSASGGSIRRRRPGGRCTATRPRTRSGWTRRRAAAG
ncbi:hypothetical protein [Streptomyces sp. AV19]|uniref:hypothetical protein n=1 Tax=Streptomyces sp. AV19 TaxID=2793068 RepID=UPI001F3A5CAD|nr:hypothetical protein [Streptomyces sp. AV19]MDG4531723.1 hypothetical protein [Streptomyces sp. AV19]